MTERDTIIWEGKLIRQLARLHEVQGKLIKQLVHGITDSEVAGAYMDLRNIANQVELLHKEIH